MKTVLFGEVAIAIDVVVSLNKGFVDFKKTDYDYRCAEHRSHSLPEHEHD